MLEARSALAEWKAVQDEPPEATRAHLRELAGLELIQLGFWSDTQDVVAQRLQARIGAGIPDGQIAVAGTGNVCIMRIAPYKIWVTGQREGGLAGSVSAAVGTDAAAITDLSHARTILQIDGPAAADVVRRLVSVDIHEAVFPSDSFAQTSLFGVGILLHAVPGNEETAAYNFYLPRSFAMSLAELIAKVAAPFGCRVSG